jgi:hypothetical protein
LREKYAFYIIINVFLVDDFKARKSRYLLGQAQPMKSLGCIASAFKITRFPPPSNPNWKKKRKVYAQPPQ